MMTANSKWKMVAMIGVLGASGIAASRALADSPANAERFVGTYIDTLPERAEIMQLNKDGTAHMTLSDQVTFGAGGFIFSESLGSWRMSGPRQVSLRMTNLNFDITGLPTYTGAAVIDYTLDFSPGFDTFSGSCYGRIFPTGTDPFAPGAVPFTEFDCAYLDGFPYRRVMAP